MPIDRIHLLIGRQHDTVPVQVETDLELGEGNEVHGQVNGYSKAELHPFLIAFEADKLYARVRGTDYKVTNLAADGRFTLQKLIGD